MDGESAGWFVKERQGDTLDQWVNFGQCSFFQEGHLLGGLPIFHPPGSPSNQKPMVVPAMDQFVDIGNGWGNVGNHLIGFW